MLCVTQPGSIAVKRMGDDSGITASDRVPIPIIAPAEVAFCKRLR
ncbi:hypothetical protein SAMN05216516_10284 [Izhakiella capsodis]|uniref:Uncharacterized protein n=1 Tax=Izhakiella capsodis TaxID=1367852 RepID=A0A1I4VU56_9GAMM|nr:hypothetical protein SAMN05216516_10284 [Izhakiella capsodis]